MVHKVEGLEELIKAGEMLSGVLPVLDKFVQANKHIIPDEHKHLIEGLNTKSMAELENLQKEINKLSA